MSDDSTATTPPTTSDLVATASDRDPEQGAALPKEPPPPGTYEARAGSYYRNVRYLITLAMLAAGAWFLYDGFVKWPREQQRFRDLSAELKAASERGETTEVARLDRELKEPGAADHSDTDILLQRILGFTLPPLGILLLVRWLYISRGTIRLDGSDTLHAPGHPAVPVSTITEINDDLWERKGISYISYEGAEGTAGEIKLDDFVYERKPIDQIHDRLRHLNPTRQTD